MKTMYGMRSTTPRSLLAGIVIVVGLALIFLAYLRPEFALDLMNRFILCL